MVQENYRTLRAAEIRGNTTLLHQLKQVSSGGSEHEYPESGNKSLYRAAQIFTMTLNQLNFPAAESLANNLSWKPSQPMSGWDPALQVLYKSCTER